MKTGGDRIDQIWRENAPKVRALARKLVRNEQDAEDAVGSTFLRVVRYRQHFAQADEHEVKRLLIIYARSACFDLLDRRKKREAVNIALDVLDGAGELFADGEDFVEALLLRDEAARAKACIDALPSPAREIVILKYYFDTPNREIADLLGMNRSTVSTILQRSLLRIRKEMEERHEKD